MNNAAYLVAVLDTRVSPPVVKGCGIYSESAMSLTGAQTNEVFTVDVMVVHGKDYEDALNRMKQYLRFEFTLDYSPFKWLEPFLKDEMER